MDDIMGNILYIFSSMFKYIFEIVPKYSHTYYIKAFSLDSMAVINNVCTQAYYTMY